MAIFNFRKKAAKVKDENEATTTQPASDLSPQVDDVLLRAFLSNEPITREMAMTIPAVSSAVDLISSTIASMPVKLYRYKSGEVQTDEEGNKIRKPGRIEPVERDPRIRMLNGDTGDVINGYQLKQNMVEDYLLAKGGFAYIQRNRNDVTGLYYVKEMYVVPYYIPDPIYKYVSFLIGTHQYHNYEILKLMRKSKDGAYGIGLIDEVSKALQTAYKTMQFQLGLVQRGGTKRGFLKSPRKLEQKALDALQLGFSKMFGTGEENVVVLNNGLEFQEASSTAAEMQLDQNKKTLTDEINAIFHVYPDDFDKTFKEAIYPIIKAFETELNNNLLLESEKKNYFFEFDVKEILRTNIKDRYDAYEKALKSGWTTVNEVRRKENMNAVEGMDVLNLQLSAVLYDTNTHQYYTPNTGVKTGSTEDYLDGDGNQVQLTKIEKSDGGDEKASENADEKQEKGNNNDKA